MELEQTRPLFLESGLSQHKLSGDIGGRQFDSQPSPKPASLVYPLNLFLFLFLFLSGALASAQSVQTPPNPPQTQQSEKVVPATATIPKSPTEAPCQIKRDGDAFLMAAAAGAVAPDPANPPLSPSLEPTSCPPLVPLIDWYARFLNGPQVKRFSPKEKGLLAIRNFIDPFNGVTIVANSAIYVGINPHSAYGPGLKGFIKNVGVSYTQDGIAEFFGTFAIPSIVHQDPHYHRMPEAGLAHRFAHAIYQVGWTQGDDGRGMLNYGNLLGYAIDGQLENFYVPGIETNASATLSRYIIVLGTAPAENLIIEFLPDFARHIHIRVLLLQRIIDQVARTSRAE
jgi:hypothetical protein